MSKTTTIGLDIAKSVFQVHGINGGWSVVLLKQVRRRAMIGRLAIVVSVAASLSAYTAFSQSDAEISACVSEDGDPSSRIEACSDIIGPNPTSQTAYALISRGNAHYLLGQYGDAIHDYDRAILLDPSYPPAYRNRGVAYAELGEHHIALENYELALDLDPNNPLAYNSRGNSYYSLGHLYLALDSFNRALQLDPSSASILENRGQAYAALEKNELAIVDFERSLSFDPNHASTYINRGIVFMRQGRLAQAVEDFVRAIELDPLSTDSYQNLTIAYCRLGNRNRATTTLVSLFETYELQNRRDLQQVLSDGGFYSGPLDGQPNSDVEIALGEYIDVRCEPCCDTKSLRLITVDKVTETVH